MKFYTYKITYFYNTELNQSCETFEFTEPEYIECNDALIAAHAHIASHFSDNKDCENAEIEIFADDGRSEAELIDISKVENLNFFIENFGNSNLLESFGISEAVEKLKTFI